MQFNNGSTGNRLVSVRSNDSYIYNVDTRLLNVQKGECEDSKTGTITESQNRGEISFMVPLFNIFYYLLLSPFKTVLDKESNQYRIETSFLHKIICPLPHIGAVIFYVFFFSLVGFNLHRLQDPSIVLIFDFVSNFTAFVSVVLIIFILWRRREQYLQVIECTRVTVKNAKTIINLIYLVLMVSCVAWGITYWFMLHDGGYYVNLYSLDSEILERNASSHKLINNSSPNVPGFVLYVGLDILMVHVSLFYILVAHGFFAMLVLSLGQLGRMFITEMVTTTDIQSGTELYRRLKEKTDTIKNLYGNNLLAYYITAVCYCAEAPHVLLGKRGNTEKVSMVYFGLTSVIWVLAADFHKNIQETVQKWIAFHTANANLSIEDRLKLVAISNEMMTDPVALSSRHFCVTYEQLSSMLGLVVTYGIIVFQLHNGPSCTETFEA